MKIALSTTRERFRTDVGKDFLLSMVEAWLNKLAAGETLQVTLRIHDEPTTAPQDFTQ